MSRDGTWIKLAMFVLGVVMLAGITKVLLDPGYGSVDESRRTRHQSGFSIIGPRGWGAALTEDRDSGTIRLSPDRQTGRPTWLIVSLLETSLPPDDAAVDFTFQGEPAKLIKGKTKHDWQWEVRFSRNGRHFSIKYVTRLEDDVEHGPLMPFINSFRVEPTAATDRSMPAMTPPAFPLLEPDTQPAGVPASGPATGRAR